MTHVVRMICSYFPYSGVFISSDIRYPIKCNRFRADTLYGKYKNVFFHAFCLYDNDLLFPANLKQFFIKTTLIETFIISYRNLLSFYELLCL